jgi:hypothetical protein
MRVTYLQRLFLRSCLLSNRALKKSRPKAYKPFVNSNPLAHGSTDVTTTERKKAKVSYSSCYIVRELQLERISLCCYYGSSRW